MPAKSKAALRDAASRLQAAGWTVEEKPCPPLRRAVAIQLMLWLAEFRRGGPDAIRREGDPDASCVYAEMEKLCPPPTLEALMDALQARAALCREWQLYLKDNPILLLPVSAELPFPDQLDVQSPAAFARVWEAQLTQIGTPVMGLPGLTVTTGSVGTVPVGVHLVAGRWREDLLLEAGAAIEAAGAPVTACDPA